MSGIHDEIMEYVQGLLQDALIDNIDPSDEARAGVVKLGELQGEPEPDTARISVTVHENDPDGFDFAGRGSWADKVDQVECGGALTWLRRFTVKARCLLESTHESLAVARRIQSTVKERIEEALLGALFVGVASYDEYVSRGPLGEGMSVDMLQAGGPTSYDMQVKIRFEVLTTRTGVFQ